VLGPDLVRLALAAGQPAQAEQVAAAVAQIAAHNQVASLTGAALRCQGLATDDPEALRSAVAAYASSGRPPGSWPWPPRTPPAGWPGSRPGCASWACAAAAAAPAGLGQPHPDRAPGGRPGGGGPVQPPDRPAPVRLPAHGADHLAHVFTKLEITSRTQLAAEATTS
jgi:hypothetical protein